jgi:uncharacterized protein YbjT (DUF2867 family)
LSEQLTLVAGATGTLGLQICATLARGGGRVRALVRPTADPAKVARLRAYGAELVEGDLEQPETLLPAVADVAAVITTVSSFPRDLRPDAIDRLERQGSINLVDTAAAAGVRRFVYTSNRAVVPEYPFSQAKAAVESHLAGSGLEYTILRPGNFMEVWFSPLLGFDLAGGEVAVYGDGTARVTWISSADVAEFAVWAVAADAARNATLHLGGPEALSFLDVVTVYEELTGKPLVLRHVPLAELERQYEEASGPRERSLAGVMLATARGGVTDMRELVAESGIRLTPVRTFAARQLASAE